MILLCLALAWPLRAEVRMMPAPSGTQEMLIWSSLDQDLAAPLLAAFQTRHPEIAIRYEDLLTGQIHARVMQATDTGGRVADFVFSSAMDLQVKLANDGYGRRVVTPQTAEWPGWAMWRETAYALTYEPAVFAWHRPSFKDHPPPETRAGLVAWMQAYPEAAMGRTATYDITRSGVGYLLMARDQDLFPGIWQVLAAMADAKAQYHPTSGEILTRIASGEVAVGYNLLGSYVAQWARMYPDEIGMTLPKDFTVVASRVALVPKAAARPDLGERLLGWLMSPEGQNELSRLLRLPAVSLGVTEGATPTGALSDLTGLQLKPVPVGPGLLAYLDKATRAQLIARWKAAQGR